MRDLRHLPSWSPRAVRALLLVVAFVVPACDDDTPSSSCAEEDCFFPPAPRCDGADIVRSAIGTCEGGACAFPETRTPCAFGCDDGACLPDPCDALACDPPAPRCDDHVAVRYDAPTCAEGICDIGPETRRDCSTDNRICVDGRCVTDPACAAIDCETPPAAFCDGDAATAWENGRCADGTCAWDAVVTVCNDGRICRDGACVLENACAGVSCTTPPPDDCDGTTARRFGPGTCNATTGQCDWTVDAADCADEGLACVRGACVEAVVCGGNACDAPPSDTCEGLTAVVHDLPPTCAGDACAWDPRRVDCGFFNQICADGACVDGDPCASVTCDSPPAAFCEGTTFVASSGGTCTRGRCSYTTTRTNCADQGLDCTSSGCANACEGVSCSTPPGPFCDRGRAITSQLPGQCAGGACRYTTTVSDCVAAGGTCDAGACIFVDPCEGVTCNAPPAPRCDGGVSVVWTGEAGTCFGGTCRYPTERVDCIDAGVFCFEGECTPDDPCPLLDCSTPPPPVCDGTNLVRFDTPSFCASGQCIYAATSVDCAAGGGRCDDGRCVEADLCAVLDCRFPPGPSCEGTTAVRFALPTDCTTGSCAYPEVRERCDTPSAPRCVGDVLIEPSAGTCQLGACARTETITDCASTGLVCADGACRSTEGCDGVTCTTPPAPRCEGSVVVRAAASGTCALGACSYPELDIVDCSSLGQVCVNGACAPPDVCASVTCNACPAPTCSGDTVVEFACPGTCSGGACSYLPSPSTNCAALGQTCFQGACRPLDLCEITTCDAPPAPLCDGPALISFAASGACDEGFCDYPFTVERCDSRIGGFCENGACDWSDPCVGVSCPTDLPSTCSSRLTRRVPAPFCQDGFCFASFDLVPCPTGTYCDDGACISAEACATGCTTPPAPVCVGDDRQTAMTFAPPATCDGTGGCQYTESTINCAADGRICVDGACRARATLAPGDLVISELMLRPPGDDPTRRWFEIHNRSELPQVLNGLQVRNGASGAFTFPASPDLLVPPGDYLLVAASAAAIPSGYPRVLWPAGFSISPTSDTLTLARPDNTVIAQLAWGAGWPIVPTQSTSLSPAAIATAPTDIGSWCANLPTPGLANRDCPSTPPRAPATGELAFTELHLNPGAGAHAFVEFINLAPVLLDLSGLVIELPGGASATLPAGATVAPGGVFTVSGGTSVPNADAVSAGFQASGAGPVRLRAGTTTIREISTSTGTWTFPQGRSLAWCGSPDGPNGDVSTWVTAWVPFAPARFGSPGAPWRECGPSDRPCTVTADCTPSPDECVGDAAVAYGAGACVSSVCVYTSTRSATWCPSSSQSCNLGRCE